MGREDSTARGRRAKKILNQRGRRKDFYKPIKKIFRTHVQASYFKIGLIFKKNVCNKKVALSNIFRFGRKMSNMCGGIFASRESFSSFVPLKQNLAMYLLKIISSSCQEKQSGTQLMIRPS